jgi:transposase-like protein
MSTSIPSASPRWAPPHCPNPNCPYYTHSHGPWPFQRRGSFPRRNPPRRVPRFQCRHCHRSFSQQTFSTTYWLKKPRLLPRIFDLSVGAMANCQLARALQCAPATVDSQLARLARHCLLFQRQLLAQASPPVDIAIDGFTTFEASQYFPFEFLVAVNRENSFLEHFTEAPLRRSGRMTDAQKKRRTALEVAFGRPDPKAVETGMREVLTVTLAGATTATVHSDEHRAYPRAMRGLACEITHQTISSRARRDTRNPLFEINALDAFIRHSRADHRRETLAFARRRQASAERLAVFVVWKNFVKKRWERRCRATPAMLRGLVDRVLTVEDILATRLFPGRIPLPERWREYYGRLVETPVLGVNRRHTLKYAF